MHGVLRGFGSRFVTTRLVAALFALLVAGVVAMACFAAAALASRSSLDAASTRSFVAAADRVVGVEIRLRSRERQAVKALIAHVESSCPHTIPAGVRTGTRQQQRTWTAFVNEAAVELGLAEVRPLRPTVRVAIRDVEHLRWTNRRITREVAASTHRGRAALRLRAPDLCSEAEKAAPSNFSVTPARTVSFLERARIALSASTPSWSKLAQRMKPVAAPQQAIAIKRLREGEKHFDRLTDRFTLHAYFRMTGAFFGH